MNWSGETTPIHDHPWSGGTGSLGHGNLAETHANVCVWHKADEVALLVSGLKFGDKRTWLTAIDKVAERTCLTKGPDTRR